MMELSNVNKGFTHDDGKSIEVVENDKDRSSDSNKNANPSINYDKILDEIGQFGRFQIWIFIVMCLASALTGVVVVIYSFAGYVPKYRCRIPYCDEENGTYFGNDGTFPQYVVEGISKDILSKSKNCTFLDVEDLGNSSTCSQYTEALSSSKPKVARSCAQMDDLIFDTTIRDDSVVTSYGFTCDSHHTTELYGAILFLGVFAGSLFFGYLSDRCGRRIALITAILTVTISPAIGAYMPSAAGFGFFRFLMGMGGLGTFVVAFVIVIEYSGLKFTMFVGIVIAIPFAIGEFILGIEAIYIRDWRTLQIVSSLPWIILVPIIWFFVPETPRWLIAKKRYPEAIEVIRTVAKYNGRKVPEHLLLYEAPKQEDSSSTNKDDTETNKEAGFRDLFYPKLMRFRTLNMFYQWMAVTLAYYGLTFSSTDLAGDPYANFCSGVAIEIPGYLFCLFVMDCWGRRPILTFCQVVAGMSCILAGLMFLVIDDDDPKGSAVAIGFQQFFALLGKMLASAAFEIIYVYTGELYPTTIRNRAIGGCSAVARVGGVFSLVIKLLKDFWKPLPMIIMGTATVIAGFLALAFPETVGEPLPETLEDSLNIGKGNNNRGLCTCKFPVWKDDLERIIFRKKDKRTNE